MILDLGLPDTTGQDLLRRWRAGGNDVPVLQGVIEPKDMKNRIAAHLAENPETEFVLAVGTAGGEPALAAIEAAGLTGKVKTGTFDMSPITLQAVGFDPFLGFLHRLRYGRPSLALDLAEEFRPLIGDSTVLTLINNEEVGPKSFISRAGSVAMTDSGRKATIAAFERRLETEITHPIFGYKITYRRVLEVQSRLLGRALLGEIPEYPGFCTR